MLPCRAVLVGSLVVEGREAVEGDVLVVVRGEGGWREWVRASQERWLGSLCHSDAKD